MPTYEYKCPKCESISEEFLPISQANMDVYCSKDNTLLVKQLWVSAGHVVGTDNPCRGK